MPKTKTTRKSTKSKNSLPGKLSRLSTSKQRGILFVFAFALVGSFFILRSFALTPHKIIYQFGNYVYSINQDGTSKIRVATTYQFQYQNSPDGTKVVYSQSSSKPGIYVASADGTGAKRVTSTPLNTWDGQPQWKSDGKQILYTRTINTQGANSGQSTYQIRVVNSDGTNDHWVYSAGNKGMTISWVSGTEQIVGGRFDKHQIFSINSDGTGYKAILTDPFVNTDSITVSKGSTKKILYYSNGAFVTQAGLWTMSLDGSNKVHVVPETNGFEVQNLSNSGYSSGEWYQNNFLYVVNAYAAGNLLSPISSTLYRSSADGTTKKVLFTVAAPKTINSAAWAYNGSGIAFGLTNVVSNASGITSAQLLSINTIAPDGTNRQAIVSGNGKDPGFITSW